MRADGLPVSWLTLVVIGSGVVALCVGVACALGRGGDGQPGTMVASTAVLGMLGLMILPLPGELAAYDVSSRWTDATGLWGLLGAVGVAALCWGAADPWRRTALRCSGQPGREGFRGAYFGVHWEVTARRSCDHRRRPAEVSEREAREVAEAARETEWTRPSFAKELYLGRFDLSPDPPAPARRRRGRGARRGVPRPSCAAYCETLDGAA